MWVIKLIWILILKFETTRSLSIRLLTADHIGLVAKFSLTYIELVKLHYFLFRIIDVVPVVNTPKYVHNVSIHYDVLHRNNCDCGVVGGGGGAPEAVQNITKGHWTSSKWQGGRSDIIVKIRNTPKTLKMSLTKFIQYSAHTNKLI